MNRVYRENKSFHSNNRIYSAYLAGEIATTSRVGAFLSMILAFFCSTRVRMVSRILGVVFSFIGTVGLIGAMEAGSLGIAAGLLLTLTLLALTYLCLRRGRR